LSYPARSSTAGAITTTSVRAPKIADRVVRLTVETVVRS
jgi:hypothetical protein